MVNPDNFALISVEPLATNTNGTTPTILSVGVPRVLVSVLWLMICVAVSKNTSENAMSGATVSVAKPVLFPKAVPPVEAAEALPTVTAVAEEAYVVEEGKPRVTGTTNASSPPTEPLK